jgi:GAF domain-containing protein
VGRPIAAPSPSVRASLADRKLAALSEVGLTIVSDADYQQVLAALIQKVSRILDVESGGFLLYDEASHELQLQRPGYGFDDDAYRAYRVSLGGTSRTADVFLTGRPYFTNDATKAPQHPQLVRIYHIKRVLSVALQIEGKSIGVFNAINKRNGDFTVDDVELLQMIAPHLAVIIQSAGMLRSLRSNQAELERLLRIHNTLAVMAIGGHDLADLTRDLAELIQTEVVTCESRGKPIAAPASVRVVTPEVLSVLRHLTDRGAVEYDPIRVDLPDGRVAIGVPIIAIGEVLGGIVAVAARDSVGSGMVRTIQQGALVFALEIVKVREVADVEQRLRADALQHLLVAASRAEETGLFRRLGFEAGEPLRMARIVIAESLTPIVERGDATQVRLHRQLTNLFEHEWPRAAVIISDSVVLALPETDLPLAEQRRRLNRIIGKARLALPTGPRVALIAVGSAARDAAGVRRSIADTQSVIAASRLLSDPSVVFVEDLGLLGLLAQPAEAEDVRRFVGETLGPLEVGTERSSGEWLRFLEALAASNFSVKHAARHLGIPLNTARYRATRIEEKLGVNFHDADARLNVMVALRLRRVLQAKPSD